MSDDEIQNLISQAISNTGATSMADMGKVMGQLKTQLAGRADMAVVSRLLKTALSA